MEVGKQKRIRETESNQQIYEAKLFLCQLNDKPERTKQSSLDKHSLN